MAHSKKELDKLRDRCVNSLHVATMIHADETHIQNARMLLYVTEPLKEWYSQGTHGVRGRQASFDFLCTLAHGRGVLPHLTQVMQPFRDLTKLHSMGFIVDDLASYVALKGLIVDSGMVADQNEKANKLGRLMVAMVRRRVLGLAPNMYMYPYNFILLVHEDPDIVKEALSLAKSDWAVWNDIRVSTLPQWKKITGRACFQWTLVKEVFEELALVEFANVPEDVSTVLRHIFSGFATTKIVEDAMQRSRQKEDQQHNKQACMVEVLWQNLVEEKLLSNLHKFREVETGLRSKEEGSGKALDRSTYEPSFKKLRDAVPKSKELPGHSAIPPWPTFKPETFPSLASELHLMRFMSQNGRVAGVANVWRTEFLPSSTLVQHAGSTEIWLSLGCMAVTAVVLWPVEKVKLKGGLVVWSLKEIIRVNELSWIPVLDFKDWQVVPFFFASPLYMYAKLKTLPHPMPKSCMVQDGEKNHC